MPEGRQIHVVFVEDDAGMRRAMRRLLKVHDMRVTEFSSAEEFLATARDEAPDCLLLDIELGGMSGLELQARLARERSACPVIFLTACGEESHRTAAAALGCAAFIHKSDPASTVISAICNAANACATAGAVPAPEQE